MGEGTRETGWGGNRATVTTYTRRKSFQNVSSMLHTSLPSKEDPGNYRVSSTVPEDSYSPESVAGCKVLATGGELLVVDYVVVALQSTVVLQPDAHTHT